MTKKERVLQAMNGTSQTEIPACFSLHFPSTCHSGDAAVAEHLKLFQTTGMDICKVMNENMVPDFGPIRTAADWKQIPKLSMQDDFMQQQLNLTKEIRAKADPDAYFMGTLHGVCASGIHPFMEQYGYDRARQIQCDHLRENTTIVFDTLKRITEVMCELATAYVEAGMDAVYYAALGGEYRYFTEEEFATYIAPLDHQIMTAIREAGGQVFLHICKDQLDMNRYKGYDALADVVNWGIYEAPFSLQQGKALFPTSVIMGGLSNRPGGVLVDGTQEQIRDEVQKVISDYGKKGFILGADCTLPTDVNTENLRVAVESAHA